MLTEAMSRSSINTTNAALSTGYYLAGIIAAKGGNGIGTGIRGFIPTSAFPAGVQGMNSTLQAAYAGCGNTNPNLLDAQSPPALTPIPITGTPVDDGLHTSQDFKRNPPTGTPLDEYLNAGTLGKGCDTAPLQLGCSGFYANYQGPCFAPNEALLTTSTTGVSGSGNQGTQNPSGSGRGGVVFAVVPRNRGAGSFAPYDLFPYADQGEPTSQGKVAQWIYGNANPGASTANAAQRRIDPATDAATLQNDIVGWTVIRTQSVSPSDYSC